MSAATDAFLQSWDGLQAYAFPQVAIIPRVLATLRASTGTELTLVAPHWAHALGSRTCSSFRWLLQWSSRPVMTSCACLGLVIFPRISVGSGFMPSASPAIFQSLWLLIRSRGAVFAGALPSSCAVYQVRWSISREWYHTNGHSLSRPTLAKVADFLYWLRYTRGLMFPPCMVTVQCYLRCSVFTFHPCLWVR